MERELTGCGTPLIGSIVHSTDIYCVCSVCLTECWEEKGVMEKEKDDSLCPRGAKNLFKRQMLITKCKNMCRMSNYD